MKRVSVGVLLCCVLVLCSCTSYKQREIAYYADQNNYVTASGTVTHMQYTDNGETLFLGFEDLSFSFYDTSFRIVGENLVIARQNGIDEKLALGDRVELISAPRIFGDGYAVPIVGLTVDGETLLTFEQGYDNWLKWVAR